MPLTKIEKKLQKQRTKEIHDLLKNYNIAIIYFQTQLLLKLKETELVLLAEECQGDTDEFWKAAQNKHGITLNNRLKYKSTITKALKKIGPHNEPPVKKIDRGSKLKGIKQIKPIKSGPTTLYKGPKQPKVTKPFLRSSAPRKKRQMTLRYLQKLKDLYKRLISVDTNTEMFVRFEEHTT